MNCPVMESTSPRWRWVAVFQYGLGWGLGVIVLPFLNDLARSYRTFLLGTLIGQLAMLVWLQFGVFESIRWLLSENKINRAQIELQRACRINNVRNGSNLAQKIAQMHSQELRKASNFVEEKLAETSSPSVGQLSELHRAALRRSFSHQQVVDGDQIDAQTVQFNIADELPETGRKCSQIAASLSPTLARSSFSVAECDERSASLVAKDPLKVALKQTNLLRQQEEGSSFLARIFHCKLYKLTTGLILLSVMLETSYYGLIQANKFVGDDVNLNYVVGGICEWLSAGLYISILWLFSRRVALIAPTVCGSLSCLGLALTYHLLRPQSASSTLDSNIVLRDNINFWLLNVGKFAVTVAIQVGATIAMESYPNNLRQTAPGAVVFVGRLGSILAPFLFNDSSAEKTVFKCTLLALATLGLLTSCAVPLFVRDNKDKDLCDRLEEID